MDNIAKYPKDWYKQMTRNKRTRSKSEPNKATTKEKEGSKRNSTGSEPVKEDAAKETAEETEAIAE